MLPDILFEILRCPSCRARLQAGTGDEIVCQGCQARYPVVEGIPVMLANSDDTVSKKVAEFYANAWKRNDEGVLRAKIVHEDMTDYGQRFYDFTEARFESLFKGGRFFLDAACGAQPRVSFGRRYDYHVCLDFSLDGLMECRRQLGPRALCINGSLLAAPIADEVMDSVLASHCVYHIDKDLQGTAIRELSRVLRPGGRLVLFYANPDNIHSQLLERRRFRPLKAALELAQKLQPPPPPEAHIAEPLYCHLLPIEEMKRELRALHPDTQIEVRPLCVFPRHESEPLMKVFGRAAYLAYVAIEKLYQRRPDASYFLTYIADRRAA